MTKLATLILIISSLCIGTSFSSTKGFSENLTLVDYEQMTKEVKDLIDDGKIQRAIWKLEDMGRSKLARIVENELEKVMRGRIIKIEKFKHGSYLTFMLYFEYGIKGLFKAKDNSGLSMEADLMSLASYKVDRALKLNLTPMTLILDNITLPDSLALQGESTVGGHVMYFVDGANQPTGIFERSANLRFFDYLISNIDRHDKNFLITANQKVLGIDHDSTFYGTVDYDYKHNMDKMIWGILPGPEYISRLQSIPNKYWVDLLSPLMGERQINFFLERIDKFSSHISKLNASEKLSFKNKKIKTDKDLSGVIKLAYSLLGEYKGYYRLGIGEFFEKKSCRIQVQMSGHHLKDSMLNFYEKTGNEVSLIGSLPIRKLIKRSSGKKIKSKTHGKISLKFKGFSLSDFSGENFSCKNLHKEFHLNPYGKFN